MYELGDNMISRCAPSFPPVHSCCLRCRRPNIRSALIPRPRPHADKILSKMGEGAPTWGPACLPACRQRALLASACAQGRLEVASCAGTFGRVLECWDRKNKDYVAIKIVRNVQKYRDAAMIEVRSAAPLRPGVPASGTLVCSPGICGRAAAGVAASELGRCACGARLRWGRLRSWRCSTRWSATTRRGASTASACASGLTTAGTCAWCLRSWD